MVTLSEKIRLASSVVFLAGLSCIPFTRTNPESYQSAFNLFAMRGDLFFLGIWMMGVGLAGIAVSFAIKR